MIEIHFNFALQAKFLDVDADAWGIVLASLHLSTALLKINGCAYYRPIITI